MLCFVPAAGAAVKLVNPSLVASSVAGKPVTVSINAFGRGTWGAAAFVGGNQIFLGEDAYRDAEHGGGVGLFLLLHETAHTTGIADSGEAEHEADCFSLTHVKAVLRDFWHLRAGQIDLRYGDALAWPAKYAGNNCGAATARTTA
jgi:hypothetical protein